MDPLQAIILALIQGLTEFLPVSSSGHLVLPSVLLGWRDQGLAFDVAVHCGSLLAVLLYFRRDVATLIAAWLRSVSGGQASPESALAWCVIVGTLPAAMTGVLLSGWIETNLRGATVLATTTLVFGLLLGWVDWRFRGSIDLQRLGWRQALFIGCAQILALIPGTSRSGITITAALMLGFSRTAAARFSFLLSMPLITAAGGLKLLELLQAGVEVEWMPIILGFVVAALSALLCIHWFLRLIERIGMMPFAVYRVLLAIVIVWVAW